MPDDQKGGAPPSDKQKDKPRDKDKPPPKRKPLWPWLLGGAVVVGFVAVVLAIIFAPAPDVWTDDAYVTAHYATVSPRVSGQVASVDADDNQPVSAGQLLATIDDRDFRATLASAEAKRASLSVRLKSCRLLTTRSVAMPSGRSAIITLAGAAALGRAGAAGMTQAESA